MPETSPERYGQIFAQAITLFNGDAESAANWLLHPCRALGYRTPLEFASTEEGTQEVERVIGRLEHGVFM